jgi:hypothetical protein
MEVAQAEALSGGPLAIGKPPCLAYVRNSGLDEGDGESRLGKK